MTEHWAFLKSLHVFAYNMVRALFLVFLIFLILVPGAAETQRDEGGQWKVLIQNAGVSAMHMALLPNNKIIIFDRSDFGPSNISLPFGKCRIDPKDQVLQKDCWAHSIEYDVDNNKVRPLQIQTDTWCSSGALSPDGYLIQTGGFNDGHRAVRTFKPCDFCDWTEDPEGLAQRRWYATDQILPDGRIIIFGGRRQFNYEFVPKKQPGNSFYEFPFLQESLDSDENNLYPFVHLAPDGNLFIFANSKSILFDYVNNRVLRRYPDMPGHSRNYPNSGSSVLLPLDPGAVDAEVLICGGGGAASAYSEARRGNFLNASNTCGRLRFTEPDDPQWRMEEMPMGRVMGDMLLLPTGDVLIINGASKGSAGWGLARAPVLHPLLYKTSKSGPLRFEVLKASVTPRLYHSTCHVLPDGRVLVGGSNTNFYYNFTDVLYPTDLSLEAFSPRYLAPENDAHRPYISYMGSDVLCYGRNFTLSFLLESLVGKENESLSVTFLAPSFTTHSYSMNQRLLRLQIVDVLTYFGFGWYQITVTAPPHAALAPPGYYLLFVVHAGIPSQGKWVKLTPICEPFNDRTCPGSYY